MKRAVRVTASVLTSDPWQERDLVMPDVNTCTRIAAKKAYEMAGDRPEDLDLVELHDCFATAEILHYENLGLCGDGEAGKMIDEGEAALGGRIPVNVSGGLLSKGHPLGATGIANIYEVSTHLRGEAGKRQVDGRAARPHPRDRPRQRVRHPHPREDGLGSAPSRIQCLRYSAARNVTGAGRSFALCLASGPRSPAAVRTLRGQDRRRIRAERAEEGRARRSGRCPRSRAGRSTTSASTSRRASASAWSSTSSIRRNAASAPVSDAVARIAKLARRVQLRHRRRRDRVEPRKSRRPTRRSTGSISP